MPSVTFFAVVLLGMTTFVSAQDSCNPYFPQGVASLKASFPRNLVCNRKGTRLNPAPQTFTCTAQNLEDCAQSCYAQKGCVSFEYAAGAGDGGTNLCHKFRQRILKQDFQRNSSATSGVFYNKGCFDQQALPPPVQLVNGPGIEGDPPYDGTWSAGLGSLDNVFFRKDSTVAFSGSGYISFESNPDGSSTSPTPYAIQGYDNPFGSVPLRYQVVAALGRDTVNGNNPEGYYAQIVAESYTLFGSNICSAEYTCDQLRGTYEYVNLTATGQIPSLGSQDSIRLSIEIPAATDQGAGRDSGVADEIYFYVQPLNP